MSPRAAAYLNGVRDIAATEADRRPVCVGMRGVHRAEQRVLVKKLFASCHCLIRPSR